MDRNETIKAIKTALQRRSGKTWSVTGGRGTAWGWIEIDAPPARRTWHRREVGRGDNGEILFEEYDDPAQEYGYTSPAERAELATLLGLDRPVHCQGVSIPAGNDYWQEYVDRAEGRKPAKCGEQYWD